MRTKAMLAAFGLWLGVAVASAQPADGPGGPHKGPGGGFMGGRFAQALNLSDEQKAEFKKVMEDQRPQMQVLHQQMRENRQKLDEALKADNPDPKTVGQIVIQGRALRKQAEAQHDKTNQALRGLLSPDQQSKFDALQSLRGGGRFGRGPGFGGWGAGRPPAPPQE